ncbi:xanthine dehydrogenase-like [Pararge aegeria]|nr:xanthine dehydrogenase-like [Pararge aegeria]
MLVSGNTVRGVAPRLHDPRMMIDISGIEELKSWYIDQNLVIGSGCSLAEVMTICRTVSENDGFSYLNEMVAHFDEVAHVSVRNIMPRSQSVHALVNAGFCYKLNDSNIVEECRITIGALSTNFTRAYKTERYMVGKPLFDNATLQGAIDVLVNEMVIIADLTEPPVEYRRQMALGLFYKSILSFCPSQTVDKWYRSGALKHRETRPVSEGHQIYDTKSEMWPITKPNPKSDGLIQAAGEAQYTDDIPLMPNELFAAFVLAKVPLGTIEKIDASKALSIPGVVAFFSAKDIPGKNSFIPAPNSYNLADEELFCDGEVKYFDQPLGMIVCDTPTIANYASTMVDVTYTNVKKPVIDINAARKDPKRVSVFQSVKAKTKGDDVYKVIKGNNTVYGQYHSTMETLVCVAHPTEEGLTLYATTQWMDLVHQAASRALKLDQNRIDVKVRRIGGGYGMKLGRANQVSVATALAAHLLNRPCRLVNPLTVNMRAMGKRMPCSRDFEVGVNEKGVIQYVNCDLYGDNGYIVNEPLLALGMDVYHNCYNRDLWNYTAYNVLTDTPSNTWCRSPGTLENIAMAEFMIERISCEMKLDPLEVRIANLGDDCRDEILEMTETLKTNARYAERKIAVEKFNKENRWTKRGIRFSFLRWEPVGFMNLEVTLTVCADDGSVMLTHAGIEMGQGINTKAIQIASYILKIPVDKIQVKGNDTIIAPNCSPSGGSITSQNVGIGVRRCCEELLKRLEPIKSQMDNPTWVELTQKAMASQVQLKVSSYTTSSDMIKYDICGVALAEVEIDVLTGEFQIKRTDVIVDCGQTINPEVDIGQMEGAFLMGLGYWTCEKLVYNPSNGELMTNRTWLYYIPQSLDIPQVSTIICQKNSYSTEAVYGAKGTGEPATCLSVVISFALRAAMQAARKDCGLPDDEWFQIDGPLTLDKICMATETKPEDFKIY